MRVSTNWLKGIHLESWFGSTKRWLPKKVPRADKVAAMLKHNKEEIKQLEMNLSIYIKSEHPFAWWRLGTADNRAGIFCSFYKTAKILISWLNPAIRKWFEEKYRIPSASALRRMAAGSYTWSTKGLAPRKVPGLLFTIFSIQIILKIRLYT